MARLDTYFAVVDIVAILGDKFVQAFQYEVTGTNQSFSDYTVTASLKDLQGNTVTTFTVTKSTDIVTDDTITLSAIPSALPTDEGLYRYAVKQTLTADSTNVTTIIKGTIQIIEDYTT